MVLMCRYWGNSIFLNGQIRKCQHVNNGLWSPNYISSGYSSNLFYGNNSDLGFISIWKIRSNSHLFNLSLSLNQFMKVATMNSNLIYGLEFVSIWKSKPNLLFQQQL